MSGTDLYWRLPSEALWDIHAPILFPRTIISSSAGSNNKWHLLGTISPPMRFSSRSRSLCPTRTPTRPYSRWQRGVPSTEGRNRRTWRHSRRNWEQKINLRRNPKTNGGLCPRIKLSKVGRRIHLNIVPTARTGQAISPSQRSIRSGRRRHWIFRSRKVVR